MIHQASDESSSQKQNGKISAKQTRYFSVQFREFDAINDEQAAPYTFRNMISHPIIEYSGTVRYRGKDGIQYSTR